MTTLIGNVCTMVISSSTMIVHRLMQTGFDISHTKICCYANHTKDEPIVYHPSRTFKLRCVVFDFNDRFQLIWLRKSFVLFLCGKCVCCSIRIVLRDICGNFINCKQTIYFYILTVVTHRVDETCVFC